MSGTAIAHYLLRNNGAVTAVTQQIKVGEIQPKIAPPAISVQMVSSRQRNNVAMNSPSFLIIERVQITAVVAQGSTPTNLLNAIRTALAHQRGAINGVVCDSIIPDNESAPLEDSDSLLVFYPMDYFITYQR